MESTGTRSCRSFKYSLDSDHFFPLHQWSECEFLLFHKCFRSVIFWSRLDGEQPGGVIADKIFDDLSSLTVWFLFVLLAVVPCSSSFATKCCQNVHRLADPTGYRYRYCRLATKHRWKKLEIDFSRLSNPWRKVLFSTDMLKTTFLKNIKKCQIRFIPLRQQQCSRSWSAPIPVFRIRICIKMVTLDPHLHPQ